MDIFNNHPVVQVVVGLVMFYVGLKWFAGGFKAMGDVAWLSYFTGNILYMFPRRDRTDSRLAVFFIVYGSNRRSNGRRDCPLTCSNSFHPRC